MEGKKLTSEIWWKYLEDDWKNIENIFLEYCPSLLESAKNLKKEKSNKILGIIRNVWVEANKDIVNREAKPPYRIIYMTKAHILLEFLNFAQGVL